MHHTARIFIKHKENQLLIEPVGLCSESFRQRIRSAPYLEWIKKKKVIKKGQVIEKSYILAHYVSQQDFNNILAILEQEFEDINFDAHDYYEGYIALEKWIKEKGY